MVCVIDYIFFMFVDHPKGKCRLLWKILEVRRKHILIYRIILNNEHERFKANNSN